MTKIVSFVCAVLLIVTAVPQAAATPGAEEACTKPGEHLESLFSIWGESKHWALLLDGVGNCRNHRIYVAKAMPFLVWTGGDQIPKGAGVTFTVRNVTCVQGTVGGGPGRVARVADCKLAYPGQKLLAAQTPEELAKAITADGEFVINWDGMTERITWLYGSPG